MFQKDRDRKIGVFQRAMLLLGEEMEREPYRDLLGRVYQDVAGTAGKRALSAVYTPDAICKMTAGMGMDIELVRARIRRGETGENWSWTLPKVKSPTSLSSAVRASRKAAGRMKFFAYRTRGCGSACYRATSA